jgi:predicted Fe-S protein YdhL (DUF1289 family)
MEEKIRWSDMTDQQRTETIRCIRAVAIFVRGIRLSEYGQGSDSVAAIHLDAAADELENPTWE